MKILLFLAASISMAFVASLAQAADRFLPDTKFVDQAGHSFSFASLRGKNVVLSFIYTRCRDTNECPLISAKFAQLQDRLDAKTHLVEVTIDPAYDRPAVLATYAKAYGFRPDRVTLITGEPSQVLEFARTLGVNAFTDPKYGFIHNENTVIADASGRVIEMFPESSWTVDEIVSVLAHRNSPHFNWNAVDIAAFVAVILAAVWIVGRVVRAVARER